MSLSYQYGIPVHLRTEYPIARKHDQTDIPSATVKFFYGLVKNEVFLSIHGINQVSRSISQGVQPSFCLIRSLVYLLRETCR
jgi:hypothetical protein